jgi:hypothetical protein
MSPQRSKVVTVVAALAVLAVLLGAPGVQAQTRPDEASMFGDAPEADAGSDAPARTDLAPAAGDAASVPAERDAAQLGGPAIRNKFDTEEVKSDALKVGGTLNVFGQGYFQEGRPFEQGSFSAPMILDAYLDGRPNDRVRAFVLGRVQYDPTRPAGSAASTSTAAASTGTASLVGLTTSSGVNPSVALDQLWLRFDVARTVYFTVGRQKVRWGVSHIWYPTDFLNSQPRDALNPFDVRLGVNMVKVHVPVESLGWNFYGYGLLDSVTIGANGITLDQLGGALRAELVLGPAELGLGAVWQKGRRPRYGADLSSAVGPVDLYAEAALRDGRDFLTFQYPSDLTADNALSRLDSIVAQRPQGVVAQISGGLSWQFNYTDKNSAILGVEYFYNPVGYTDAVGYQVKTFAPVLKGLTLDPIQNAPLYGGQHNLAVTLTSPGIPGYDWITVNLTNIVIFNDPSALSRLDLIFRVLTYLNVQVFGAVLYGQPGGQLRFQLTSREIDDLANLTSTTPAQVDATRASLAPLRYPPIVQAGVLLRLSI